MQGIPWAVYARCEWMRCADAKCVHVISLHIKRDLNEWGSMAGQAKHLWSLIELLEFQLTHTSGSASLFWLKASPEHLNKSRTSKLCFRHCNIIPKSTGGCGTSTLCLISQGASFKTEWEQGREFVDKSSSFCGPWDQGRLCLEQAHCAYLVISYSDRAAQVIAPKILGLFSFFT